MCLGATLAADLHVAFPAAMPLNIQTYQCTLHRLQPYGVYRVAEPVQEQLLVGIAYALSDQSWSGLRLAQFINNRTACKGALGFPFGHRTY